MYVCVGCSFPDCTWSKATSSHGQTFCLSAIHSHPHHSLCDNEGAAPHLHHLHLDQSAFDHCPWPLGTQQQMTASWCLASSTSGLAIPLCLHSLHLHSPIFLQLTARHPHFGLDTSISTCHCISKCNSAPPQTLLNGSEPKQRGVEHPGENPRSTAANFTIDAHRV